MIKYKDLVKKTMPIEKKKKASKCIVGHYLVRPISNIISIPLIEKKVNPTTVTIISGIFPLIAICAFCFLNDPIGFWIGWVSIFSWNVLDGVDGNIARYNNLCSKHGELWDATVGWGATISFYVGMGFTSYRNPGYILEALGFNPIYYLLMGFVASMSWIFPRLVMQKKSVLFGEESIGKVKQRENYCFVKLVFFNITSINGMAAVIYLLSFISNMNGICMVCYFVLSLAVMVGSLFSLLKQ